MGKVFFSFCFEKARACFLSPVKVKDNHPEISFLCLFIISERLLSSDFTR